MKKRHAFTLVEMLVVIAIIGIVATLVAGMASHAKTAQRKAQVDGDKAKLTGMIEYYHDKLNFYPPDNALLVSLAPGAYYDAVAATNPLLYELTGATNFPSTGNILLLDGTNTSLNYSNLFGRAGVNNTGQDASPQNFFSPGPQPKEYTNYDSVTGLKGLLVPVPLTTTPSTNFWHYDASSTNRHNPSGYDLWAEYISATKGGSNIITTNGNW